MSAKPMQKKKKRPTQQKKVRAKERRAPGLRLEDLEEQKTGEVRGQGFPIRGHVWSGVYDYPLP